jgi:hypothetical protein
MGTVSRDLQKVHQKYHELLTEKGEEFAGGFLAYMLHVDYQQQDPQQVLLDYVWLRHAGSLAHEVEAIVSGEVESDLVQGFHYAKQYSRELKFTYTD